MALENHTWGAEHIQGELLNLGIKLGKPTIQKYIDQVRKKRRSGQNWSTFLKNHAHQLWACDFTVVNDLLFRPLHIFIIIAHKTRRIIHFAVTRHPTDAWVAQQLREATPWGRQPRYLIRDNDKKYGKLFRKVARSSFIKELLTPIEAPRANGICERFMGSIKRECLDYFLILHPNQLHRIVETYVTYYPTTYSCSVQGETSSFIEEGERQNHLDTGAAWAASYLCLRECDAITDPYSNR